MADEQAAARARARLANERPAGYRDKSLTGWLKATAAHSVLIPMWTMSPLPLLLGLILLLTSKWAAGLVLLAIFTVLNMVKFPYVPAAAKAFEVARMENYYNECELRGALDSMRREKTLYCFHPHGILAVGFVVNGCWSTEFHERTAAPGKRKGQAPVHTCFLIASALREISGFFKVMCDLTGRLESAKKSVFHKQMSQGRNLAIIPGGFEDSTLLEWGVERTYLNERKGLVKYCLQHGYAMTPIYTFGESETYRTFTALLDWRLWLNKFSVPGVLFFGEPFFPLFPRRDSKCLSYVGEPLLLPRVEEPSAAQVDEWHAKYVQALRDVFEENKAEAGKPNAKLEIW